MEAILSAQMIADVMNTTQVKAIRIQQEVNYFDLTPPVSNSTIIFPINSSQTVYIVNKCSLFPYHLQHRIYIIVQEKRKSSVSFLKIKEGKIGSESRMDMFPGGAEEEAVSHLDEDSDDDICN